MPSDDTEMSSTLALGITLKEDGKTYTGLIATTHPDRVGDILSKTALEQMVERINSDAAGGTQGAYRSISLYHDWVRQKDPTLDEAGFIIPGTAEIVALKDGHHAVKVDFVVNEHYRGQMPADEVHDRIKNGSIAGLSIEFRPDESQSRKVSYHGQEYRFVNAIEEFAGVGFARARMIANPQAIIYREIEDLASKEEIIVQEPAQEPEQTVPQEAPVEPVVEPEQKEQSPVAEEVPTAEPVAQPDVKETEVTTDAALEIKERAVKEFLESKEFQTAVDAEIAKTVERKVLLHDKEAGSMTTEPILSVKEMNAALGSKDMFEFKEAASKYFSERNDLLFKEMKGAGIPLNTTLQVKCDGTKLRIVGNFEVKDTLDTSSNTTTYTQSPVEFADIFLPAIVETFNQQTNLFGVLRKVPHLEGGNKYGWRLAADQKSGLSVDPDDPSVTKSPVAKIKLQTDIKEYRVGVSVTDYMLHHSRASIGDLFMIEVEKRMRDLMKDINGDLFAEVVDTTGTAILGLEAVADSAGNTSMYGLTRSTANRLAPDSAADTYQAVGGALTTALARGAVRKVEVDGASRSSLRIVVNPIQRDKLLELEKSNIRYMGDPAMANLGFGLKNGAVQLMWDGIPMVVDPDCNTDALYVIDDESYYIVVSRPPQMIGLAKVGAAEEAFISIYLAAVYEKPRRIHMLDTLTT
jgi:hypothetical protein